ncbi:MAG: MFS transporter, partial [Myxococcaceae bacterium]
GTAAFWLAPSLATAGVIIFCMGAAYLTCLAGLNTVVQSRAPRGLQARMISLYSMLLGGGYAIGLVAMGWMGDHFGIRWVGAGCALACLLLWVSLRVARPSLLQALEAPKEAPPLAVASAVSAPE